MIQIPKTPVDDDSEQNRALRRDLRPIADFALTVSIKLAAYQIGSGFFLRAPRSLARPVVYFADVSRTERL
jgi:hypothetical protein